MRPCERCSTPIPGHPGARCPHCDGRRPVKVQGTVALLGLSLLAGGLGGCAQAEYGTIVTDDTDQSEVAVGEAEGQSSSMISKRPKS